MGDSIYLNCTNFVKLENFRDELTEALIAGATVTAKIYDEKDGTQKGSTISMPNTSGGDYEGTIAYDHTGLYAGMKGRIEIFADGGTGKRLTKQVKVSVKADR